MGRVIRSEQARLQVQRILALEELRKVAPEATERLISAEAGLRALESPEKIYAHLHKYPDAFRAVLQHEGRPMRDYEMIDRLAEGGFRMDSKRGRYLAKHGLESAARRGFFVRDKDGFYSLPAESTK